jgi:prolyl oligopeptidase
MSSHPPYPPAEPRPVANDIGGIRFDDPFQWLEQNTAEVLAWQAAQNALTTRALNEYAHANAIRRCLEETFVDVFAFYAPREIGSRWWRQYRPQGASFPVLEVADSARGPGRVVVDLNRGAFKQPLLGSWQPSPDGRLLLYAVSDGGHPAAYRVIDVESGRSVMEGLDGESSGIYFTTWDASGRDLYFTATALEPGADGQPRPVTRLYSQSVGTGTRRRLEPVDFPHPAVWLALSADGRFLVAMMNQTAARPAYLKNLGDGTWRPFLRDLDGTCKGHFVGDEYIAVTSVGATRGRVVSVPLATPMDIATWRELVPESDATLASVTPLGEQLIVADFVRGRARIRIADRSGRIVGEVPLPGAGAAGKFGVGHILSIIDDVVAAGPSGITFVYSSVTEAPASYRWSPDGGLELLSRPKVLLEDVAIEERTAVSADGSRVLYRVYRPRGAAPDAPTVLTGYGGFNVPWLPVYDALGAAWLRAGGVWVHAHLRGGGEFGTAWWDAGRMHRKQNTFDDLYAVAEALIATGVTSAARLAVFGSSNGGLLAGAAAVQRPQLFAASVPQVPILDLLRYKYDVASFSIAVADYGNPDIPADAVALYACSPYHHISAGTRYPAIFLDAGSNDTSCPAWHSRKMAARLQLASGSDRPVLLRVREGAGHNVMSEAQVKERLFEELVFLAQHTELAAR